VFLHTCEEDGTFVSYFVPADKNEYCGDADEELPVCCALDETEKEDDCCGDEMKHFKVDLDYFQKINGHFVPFFYTRQATRIINVELNEVLYSIIHTYANPPPKAQNVNRSLSQVWII
jgi:hypothetical protein